MNTLSDGSATVTLDDSLFWVDRYNWQPVEQTVQRSITGALLVHEMAMHYGQPVTLTGERAGLGWMRLADVQQCRTWAATPGQELTLVYQGQTLAVAWRHHERAIDAAPVNPLTDEQADDDYVVTLRLMTVEP